MSLATPGTVEKLRKALREAQRLKESCGECYRVGIQMIILPSHDSYSDSTGTVAV